MTDFTAVLKLAEKIKTAVKFQKLSLSAVKYLGTSLQFRSWLKNRNCSEVPRGFTADRSDISPFTACLRFLS
jgi:hypothetical protein